MRPPDERRGRWWLAWSFLACPCHLPLTLALVGSVAGGTALGAALHRHTLLAGLVLSAVWLAGTARGLQLVRRAERGDLSCRIPASRPTVAGATAVSAERRRARSDHTGARRDGRRGRPWR
jgi:hypothetical protein